MSSDNDPRWRTDDGSWQQGPSSGNAWRSNDTSRSDSYRSEQRIFDRDGQSVGPQPGQGELSRDDDRTFAILAHLSGLAGMILSAGSLCFIGPLLIWFLYKDRSPYVRTAAARSFNFNLGMSVGFIIGWVLFLTIILIPVAIAVWIGIFAMSIYFPIKAVLVASQYKVARYPFQIALLS